VSPYEFINKWFSYALVGATTNKDNYGYRVLVDLQKAGFNVVGVNPKYTEIEGVPVYPSLQELPQNPDVVIFVVPPKVGLDMLPQVAKLSIKKVWFQPGAESEEIRVRARELGVEIIADGSCIMVSRRNLGL
jgi:uncharacterized protein